jgi:hypothetical protein
MDFGLGCASIKAARSVSETGVEFPWYILGELAMADEEVNVIATIDIYYLIPYQPNIILVGAALLCARLLFLSFGPAKSTYELVGRLWSPNHFVLVVAIYHLYAESCLYGLVNLSI